VDVTRQVDSWRLRDDRAAARRGIALESIEALGAGATEAQLCRRAVTALAADADEHPFVMVYVLTADGRGARLAASCGIEEGSRWSPRFVDFEAGDGWPLEHVAATAEPVELARVEQRFGARPRGLPVVRAVRLLPLRARGADRVRAVLVAGVGEGGDAAMDHLRATADHLAAALSRAASRAEERAARDAQPVLPVF